MTLIRAFFLIVFIVIGVALFLASFYDDDWKRRK